MAAAAAVSKNALATARVHVTPTSVREACEKPTPQLYSFFYLKQSPFKFYIFPVTLIVDWVKR